MSEITNLSEYNYCNNINAYSRLKTKVVNIGNTPLGGNYPIRIQSMTNTNTLDTKATVEQSIRMIQAGCEYVRITAPGIKEAENLLEIKKSLKQKGYHIPLIADIHFNPKAAEIAAAIVEKVRINPGNYIDKKSSAKLNYTDAEYNEELQKIKLGISPLIKICKEHDTVIRIGTNHGSLSDRIVSRYGNTPKGMVESAMEFILLCEELNFQNIVLSMKASNTRIMVEAYRLLVNRMLKENINYPLHLGVTEAGEGEDGRIKSAAGIGALLEDGIGDTIRVSLTEEPEIELPVAKIIVERYNNRPQTEFPLIEEHFQINPFEYTKRETTTIKHIGGNNVPIVIADFSDLKNITEKDLTAIGYEFSTVTKKWLKKDTASDLIYIGNATCQLPDYLQILVNSDNYKANLGKDNVFPVFNKKTFLETKIKSNTINFISISSNELDEGFIAQLKQDTSIVLIIETDSIDGMAEQRKTIFSLIANKCKTPVIIKRNYSNQSIDKLQLLAAMDFGALLIDGLIDGVWIAADKNTPRNIVNSTSFNILQATRARISKTEYISCPSCGRTMFNIMAATSIIKAKTQHLKGLKIGIMGCIVNGPGEMADADYGYVGAGADKVNLYKGKQVIRKGIPATIAIEALIELIKENGDWID
ncbi:MAG: 4-hydroxy-3-methylbut-2-en-1-yl diphosphate synthase [Bacteroidetes bacterium CG2_30_32_10]|nr:MAG: 4-hydroxy-3-methylbut-2-en-1-yl diphosphate synthase [Bacteroidetes bacterium CG2_30_32_10]